MKNTLDTKETKQWRFASISICAPQWLHSFINEEIEKQAKSGAGLFSNETTIDEADETLDDLLMADAFDMKCSLEFYRKELAQYGIIGNGGLFNRDFTQMLFTALKAAVLCLKSDADKPMKARNDIAEIIKEFDNMPVWGLLFQILILQGLVSLLERLDIEEGDTGFDEGQGLCDWSFNLLLGKLVDFCYKPYGDGDKERLKPLCDFLMNTEAGNAVQSHIFGKTDNQQSENSNEAKTKQGKSQQLPGSSKTNGQGDERHDPATLNEQIFEVLPAIYDILISDSVIPSTIKKADFISNVSKGDLSGMVGKTAKFKEFVKQIKTYFNSYWYDTACKSLDFTEKQMSSYNTNNTAMLEKDLKDILKRI